MLAGPRLIMVGGTVPVGRSVRVTVPATSANLGPGFDAFGLALDWLDSSTATVVLGPHRVELTGEGAGIVPTDARHLVIATLLRGLGELSVRLSGGLRLVAHNTIPQARGLGSSSAAIVSGLAMAWGLARPGVELDLAWLVRLATKIEGHPDNVAAAGYGGFVIAYGSGGDVRVVSAHVHPDLRAAVLVPATAIGTESARGLLPAAVPHRDAASNAARAALLVHAMAHRLDLLLPATQDLLHQQYRASAMPDSDALVQRLRATGLAAVISGAGPTVMVLGTETDLALVAGVPSCGFVRADLGVGTGVQVWPAS